MTMTSLPQGDLGLLQSDAARRLLGSDIPARFAYLAMIDQPGTRMARIALRPSWVGLVGFQTRLPSTLGGVKPK